MAELLPYIFSMAVGIVLAWLWFYKSNSGHIRSEDSDKVKELKSETTVATAEMAKSTAEHKTVVEVLSRTAESSKDAADTAAADASAIKKEIEEIKRTSQNLTVEEQKSELQRRGFKVEDW